MRAVNKATTRRWDRVRTLHARARFVRSWLKIDRTHERVLLDLGASVNARAADDWTALHYAAKCGHESVVALLASRDADVNAQKSDGFTALHNAAHRGFASCVRVLLSRGAMASVRDAAGRTLAAVAFRWEPYWLVTSLTVALPAMYAGRASEVVVANEWGDETRVEVTCPE